MNPSSTTPPFDAEAFARQSVWSEYMTEEALSHLEIRLTALEEIVAARWPRRLVLLARLGRELRVKTGRYDWAGPSFQARRVEQIFTDGEAETGAGRTLRSAL